MALQKPASSSMDLQEPAPPSNHQQPKSPAPSPSNGSRLQKLLVGYSKPFECGPCKKFFNTEKGYSAHCKTQKHNRTIHPAIFCRTPPLHTRRSRIQDPPATENLFMKLEFANPQPLQFPKIHMYDMHKSRI